MDPITAAISIGSGIAKVVGANKMSGAAREARRKADELALLAEAARKRDQARAIQFRKDDEARLKANTGYDFNKLVEQAQAAGFNPLTVLQATGGAGYDGRGSVLTTPFLAEADSAWNRVNTYLGASGMVVNTAGGGASAFGDALGDLLGQFNQERAFDLEQQGLNIQKQLAALAVTRAGAGPSNGSPFSSGAVTTVDTRPAGTTSASAGYPAQWWKEGKAQGPSPADMYSSHTSFGGTTVYGEGPDPEGIATWLLIDGLNKAKGRGYVRSDVERTMWDSASDWIAAGIGGVRGAGEVFSRLGAWPVSSGPVDPAAKARIVESVRKGWNLGLPSFAGGFP